MLGCNYDFENVYGVVSNNYIGLLENVTLDASGLRIIVDEYYYESISSYRYFRTLSVGLLTGGMDLFSPDKYIEMLSGSRLDVTGFTEGQQIDSSSNTKGTQKDDLDRTYTEDYTLHRVGNIGVQTVSDMLAKHIKVWSMWEFYEYIFKEISKDLLLL